MRQTAVHTLTSLEQHQETARQKESILKVLAYFDIFHYPITRHEIKQFIDKPIDDQTLLERIRDLQEEKYIFLHHDFYSLQDNHLLAHRRKQGNLRAGRLLTKALSIGRFLQQFPFVRAVGVSGSLSKDFAEQKADIDFFIITRTNRLWLARTLMHLFKKLTYLAGHQHYYCMNYYVDEHALQLQDQNIFTAIELKTLVPVSGETAMQDFFAANVWASEYLPACAYRVQQKKDRSPSWLKRATEWLLANRLGDWLDNYLLQTTTRRWQSKQEKGRRNEKGQTMGLITGKHFARSNPGAFQEKVLGLYREKLEKLNCMIR